MVLTIKKMTLANLEHTYVRRGARVEFSWSLGWEPVGHLADEDDAGDKHGEDADADDDADDRAGMGSFFSHETAIIASIRPPIGELICLAGMP